MRRDEAFFGNDELELVHVAPTMREARRVEALLGQAGMDYGVGSDTYRTTVLFVIPVDRTGAFFWVRAADADRARASIEAAGLRPMPRDEGEADGESEN